MKKTRSVIVAGLVFIFVLGLCGSCASAPDYQYTPNAGVSVGEVYAVPSLGARKGQVQVVSLGIVDLSKVVPGAPSKVMQVRMQIHHVAADDGVWAINTNDLWLEIRGHGISRPAWVTSDPRSMEVPVMHIEPRHDKIVDLYFPLPRALQNAREIPEFEFRWQLTANGQTNGQTTSFGRLAVVAPEVSTPVGWWSGAWSIPNSAAWTFYPFELGRNESIGARG